MRVYFEKNKKTPDDPYMQDLIGRNGGRQKKQKEEIDRSSFLESSCAVMQKLRNGEVLQIHYKNEVGHGLGPTLEFYSSLS